MYRYEDIRSLHLEGTSFCNAKCPMCMRQYLPSGLRIKDLGNAEMVDFLTHTNFPPLTSVLFCGNYGDPCCHRYLPYHIQVIDSILSCEVIVETNGGMFSESYWRLLARASKKLQVVFNIDGLHSLGIYRRGVDFNSVIRNATAFIEEGGRAVWAFLVFRHNEDEVDAARQLSKDLGFSEFQIRISDRFRRNDGMVWSDYDGIRPPDKLEYRYPKGLSEEEYHALLQTTDVWCKACVNHSIYIDSTGTVFPCCFAASVRESIDDMGAALVREKLSSMTEAEYPSIRTKSLREIVEGPFFQWFDEVIPLPHRRPLVCGAVCGVGNFKLIRGQP